MRAMITVTRESDIIFQLIVTHYDNTIILTIPVVTCINDLSLLFILREAPGAKDLLKICNYWGCSQTTS